jgi:hypothetical protein
MSIGASSHLTINPTISGYTFVGQATLPEHSTLVSVYQDVQGQETRYHPVQAVQNCHRQVKFTQRECVSVI